MHTLIVTRGDDSAERTVSLEQFGFVRCFAATSSTVTLLDSDDHDVLNSEDWQHRSPKENDITVTGWRDTGGTHDCGLNMTRTTS